MRRYAYRKSYVWSNNLAYLAGLMASDGCLANNGRHIIMTSKDFEIIQYTQDILDIHTKVRTKLSQSGTYAYHFQFSNVALYDFFLDAGITPAKSKTIEAVSIPDKYYADFLRGYFDGDGTVYGYRDTRWKNSHMYYTSFVSASPKFLRWLQANNLRLFATSPGRIKKAVRAYVLTYAKVDSQVLFSHMYKFRVSPRLVRKYTKFKGFIASDPYAKIAVDARVLESVDRLA